jgi:hypothetical protein
LLENESDFSGGTLDNIKITADVYCEYKIRNVLSNMLSRYTAKLSSYKINITITEENNSIAYSEKKVIKEQGRLISKIEIFDKNYNELFNKSIDSLSTYEIDDNLPLSSMSSKKQSWDNMTNDIANNIALIIIEFIKEYTKHGRGGS